ncbi:hypothetical protein [Chryseobacterium sp. IT-36CA2]|uniref:hypothetical protein n=1 Tax=Chryseobacterium sp. IT-36CA2 TaxID=3026460 RepID=UPI0039DFDCAB
MKDILEFKMVSNEKIEAFTIDSFIFFIENHSMYWGGGFSNHDIKGSIYSEDDLIININSFMKELAAFFINLKIEIHKIEIKIESFYFNSFEYDNFIEKFSSLPISIGCWEINL